MKSSNVIPDEAKDQFWAVVKECLRVFHNRRRQVALREVGHLRNKLALAPGEEIELFFHSEPFDVACRLAGRDLDIKDFLARYLEIREHFYK